MAAFARLTLAVLGLLACSAHALAPGNISYPGGNRAILSPSALQGEANKVITNAANSARIAEDWITRIGGKNVAVQSQRMATARQIARGLAAGTGVGALAIAAQIASEYRCRADADGNWSCDKGQAKVPRNVWKCGERTASSASGAYMLCVQAAHEVVRASWMPGSASEQRGLTLEGSPSCESGSVSVRCTGMESVATVYGGTVWNRQAYTYTITEHTGQNCPEGSQDFGDGKCTQPEAQWQPQSDDEVATKLEPLVEAAPAERLRDALRSGGKVETGPITSTTGQPSVTQDPTTKTVTSPTGQPLTTTTTVTNHITYAGDTITWNDNRTTVNPDGTVETEETPAPDEKSECEKNPDSMNCADRDTPDPGDIEKKDIPVTYSPDGGWAEAGACPPSVPLSLLGQTFSVEYTPTCNFLTGMRPFVIAAASMAALLIFIGGLKE